MMLPRQHVALTTMGTGQHLNHVARLHTDVASTIQGGRLSIQTPHAPELDGKHRNTTATRTIELGLEIPAPPPCLLDLRLAAMKVVVEADGLERA
jgi:hypothetical protein